MYFDIKFQENVQMKLNATLPWKIKKTLKIYVSLFFVINLPTFPINKIECYKTNKTIQVFLCMMKDKNNFNILEYLFVIEEIV